MANFPGRTANDELWTCGSCGTTVMSRGADVTRWKGVQLTDDPVKLTWYCGEKEVCIDAMHEAISKRTRELRKRAGITAAPSVKARPKRRRLRDILSGAVGSNNVFDVPPGGFEAVERRDAPRVEEEVDREADGGGDTRAPGVQEGGRGEAGGGGPPDA